MGVSKAHGYRGAIKNPGSILFNINENLNFSSKAEIDDFHPPLISKAHRLLDFMRFLPLSIATLEVKELRIYLRFFLIHITFHYLLKSVLPLGVGNFQ